MSAPRGLKPGFTCCKRAKLFIRSAAPLRRTSASAISAMTKPLRKRLRPVPCVELRPPSLSASVSSGRALARPGTRPKMIPVPTAIASVTPNTPRSTFTSRKRGTVCAPIIFNNSTPHNARRTPATPPISASNTLSVRTCLSNRSGPAPSATRMAISRSRAAARASNIVVRFAQAISRTRKTAQSKMSSAGRIPPTAKSCNGNTSPPKLLSFP